MMRQKDYQQRLRQIRGPLMVLMVVIGFATIYVLNTQSGLVPQMWVIKLRTDMDVSMQQLIVVGGVLMEILLLWFSPFLARLQPMILFVLQFLFVLQTTWVLHALTPVLLMGLIPTVAIEIMNIYVHPRRLWRLLIGVNVVLLIVYTIFEGPIQAALVLVSMVFMLGVVVYYWRYYERQLVEKQHAEDLVAELQIAYAQVEESTIRTERQRVARELHDTLTQGLAGTVMQLEAAQKFLQQGKINQAETVIGGATTIARDTLRDSRLTLTDLRATTEKSLDARLELLADAFKKNYQLTTTIRLNYVPQFSDEQLTEISRIVSEAMINVVKHTDTRQVIINGTTAADVFTLKVIDFGSGTVGKRKGHYGMQGMHERAAKLQGALTIVGTPGEGTTVTLTVPTVMKENV
ncbi:sensor histidine kinase [Lacticaseibacillus sharpeae]|nr:sensor histidine kinase [Lacticaseibacillus sharpeae]